ncbi:hypothetical protein FP2506_18419 [Fulvimarina pelagi HTCC2506]|uniref:Fumarylacetoacetase-like C-terminal domain-containing protein n=1 Tax=Fulvimarina pelagi HTCC2506 TaxID=314231 RepID=Q0G0U9_9HYPH|nr:fumarylacetoacetate hydrolase family protein [Fulvimarina pelagi]EAU40890.1 hypothetical protein FP2506_18419 [Fulvimarina pelagi HTCC2506]
MAIERFSLPADAGKATFIGRVMREGLGPSLITLRGDRVIDITSREAPTVSALLEADDPVAVVRQTEGEDLCAVEALADGKISLLAPCDLQVIKACGVTFAQSMVERVIEEQSKGNPALADAIRGQVHAILGDSLRDLEAGSEKAAQVKAALIEKGLWSQYLEVGIGPDAEVFTKAPVLSSVGSGAKIGLHPISTWNNPEPEIVLAVDSRGRIKGASLGNDVNLRDVEGRSALLLGKAKDNNASSAIGPFIRFFDAGYTLDDVRAAELELVVEGTDGYRLDGSSSMREISRDPEMLVAQTCGPHHQYPDGFMLYLGTLFAPVQDRDVPGEGFTHKLGDIVRISNDRLGTLINEVQYSTEIDPWTFGIADLMTALCRRGLL